MIKPRPMNAPENTIAPPSKALLAEVQTFLNSHYEFWCNAGYKGFWGKLRSFSEWYDVVEHEKKETGERYDWSAFQEPETFYSSPHAEKAFREQIKKEAEERLRLAVEQSFSTALMQLIESKGIDHVEVYKRANIDRKLFSKIRTQHEYIPSKKTIIALALALELSLDETQKLLEKAGFTLSRSILSDVIIEYFITQGKYDIFEINSVLFAYNQPTFG